MARIGDALRRAGFCLPLLLSACTNYGEHYTLRVSKDYDAAHLQQVAAAGDLWVEIVPVSFELLWRDCDETGKRNVCVSPEEHAFFLTHGSPPDPHAVGLTQYDRMNESSRIYVDRGIDVQFRKIVTHELGHAMGLKHWGPRSDPYVWVDEPVVMARSVGDQPPTPSCLDAVQWYEVRKMVVPACDTIATETEAK